MVKLEVDGKLMEKIMVQDMWQITTIFHNISTYARLQADSPAYPVAEKSVSRYPHFSLGI